MKLRESGATPETADPLNGIEPIASFLTMNKRQAYHLHESGEIPTFKLGKKVYARRSTLIKHFAALERVAMQKREGR